MTVNSRSTNLLPAADWDVLLFKSAPPPKIVAARQIAVTGEPQLLTIPAGAPADSPLTSVATDESNPELRDVAVDGRWPLAGVAVLAAILLVALRRAM